MASHLSSSLSHPCPSWPMPALTHLQLLHDCPQALLGLPDHRLASSPWGRDHRGRWQNGCRGSQAHHGLPALQVLWDARHGPRTLLLLTVQISSSISCGEWPEGSSDNPTREVLWAQLCLHPHWVTLSQPLPERNELLFFIFIFKTQDLAILPRHSPTTGQCWSSDLLPF